MSDTRAYSRGSCAFPGTALLSNPYARNTPQWDDWRQGWLDAHRHCFPLEQKEQAPCPRN